MLIEKIGEDLKTAMKSGDKTKVMSLRDVKTKMAVEATKQGGSGEISDVIAIQLIGKLIKQREESAAIYETQNRPDLMQIELDQLAVLKEYMPIQLTDEEVNTIVTEAVSTTGATTAKDMGKVMAAIKEKTAGKYDGAKLAALVKSKLA